MADCKRLFYSAGKRDWARLAAIKQSKDDYRSKESQYSYAPRPAILPNLLSRAKSEDGRLLKFSNIDMTGGFIAQYADTGESYPNHECYVDGIHCYADEGHFGGIVIQPI